MHVLLPALSSHGVPPRGRGMGTALCLAGLLAATPTWGCSGGPSPGVSDAADLAADEGHDEETADPGQAEGLRDLAPREDLPPLLTGLGLADRFASGPLGASARTYVEGLYTVPDRDEDIDPVMSERIEAARVLAADPEGAARTVLPACRDWISTPVLGYPCGKLMGLFDTPETIQWLREAATLPWTFPPPDTDGEVRLPEEAVAAAIALESLAVRARAGSAAAAEVLLEAAARCAPALRPHALNRVFAAVPRLLAQRLLWDLLPVEERHLLFEVH